MRKPKGLSSSIVLPSRPGARITLWWDGVVEDISPQNLFSIRISDEYSPVRVSEGQVRRNLELIPPGPPSVELAEDETCTICLEKMSERQGAGGERGAPSYESLVSNQRDALREVMNDPRQHAKVWLTGFLGHLYMDVVSSNECSPFRSLPQPYNTEVATISTHLPRNAAYDAGVRQVSKHLPA